MRCDQCQHICAILRSMKRETYHHGDLRRALIDAAYELLRSVDPGALSLRQVSEKIGVSHAAAYRHFRDKADLWAAVSEAGFSRLTARLQTARTGAGPSYREQLAAMSDEYVRFAIEEPSVYRLMFGPRFQEQLARAGFEESARLAFFELHGTVVGAQEAGLIREGSSFLISQTIWALLHGLALLYLDGQLTADASYLITGQCWNFLWEGIEKHPGGSSGELPPGAQ